MPRNSRKGDVAREDLSEGERSGWGQRGVGASFGRAFSTLSGDQILF